MVATTIVWLRRDLRLRDNPALVAAAKRGRVLPVFIWAPQEEAPWEPGGACRWWLHHSLAALTEALERLGSRLIVREGKSLAQLERLLAETGADAVFWNRLYEPAVIERDNGIKAALKERGFGAESFNGSLLFEPWDVKNKSGQPYKVFTPYFKTCLSQAPDVTLRRVPELAAPEAWPQSEPLDSLQLEPKLDWAAGFRPRWTPGEKGALKRLEEAPRKGPSYKAERDFPALASTTSFSPHLHFGEVGPRQIWRKLGSYEEASGREILRELVWREFAHHLLFHFPHTTTEPLRPEFAKFPWRKDTAALRAWQKGRTGYPMVDAGMRELWTTGWMHNRVRMVVASFLVKHLLLPWQEGAKWFWDTLVDADLANNTLGWQWSAGSGADAAPYFRVFNPTSQAEKFDGDREYIRRWVPEVDGADYAEPIVDHQEARKRALFAYDRMRGKT